MKTNMKIFIAAVTALLIFNLSASAQNQGDMYVGGTIGGSYANKVGVFNVQAEYGYFFVDNFRGNIGIGYNHQGNSQGNRVTNDAFLLDPEVAYYLKIVDKLYYTPELGCDLGWGNTNTKIDDYSLLQPSFSWNLYLNFACFEYKPAKYLGITLGLGSVSVGGINVKDTYSTEGYYSGSFGVNLLASCTVGVKYYF